MKEDKNKEIDQADNNRKNNKLEFGIARNIGRTQANWLRQEQMRAERVR